MNFVYSFFFSKIYCQDIIGKTNVEILKGGGVKEPQDFKREVIEKGIQEKQKLLSSPNYSMPKHP